MAGTRLSELLRRVGRLVLMAEAGRTTATVTACLIGAALGAILLDAVFGLPLYGLILVDLALLAGVASALSLIVRCVSRNRHDPRRIARRIEESVGIRDSRLINAIDLNHATAAGSQSVLRERAVEAGDHAAATIVPKSAVRLNRLSRASAWAGAAVVVAALCRLTMPGVFAAVIPRYLDPSGDHPPYTLVEFDVRVSPEVTHFGKPASISARLGGPEAISRADVVFLDEIEGGGMRAGLRLPMLRGRDGEFLLPVSSAERTQQFYVDTPRGRSRRFTLQVLEVPSIELTEVVSHFPQYTGWRSTSHVLDGRGVHALAGTVTEVIITANRPLRQGRLELFRDDEEKPHQVVTLEPSSTDRMSVRGRWTLGASGRYRLNVTADNYAELVEPLEGKIRAVADRPPQISIVQPEPQLIVVEGYRIPVIVQATDDVGIGRVELRAAINGWGPTPMGIEVDLGEPTLARGFAEFDLAALGARAGDVITYSATAWDRLPPDGQFADSAEHVIQVITEEEYLEHARSEYQMNELMAEFDELQKKLDDLLQKRDAVLEELEELQKNRRNEQKPSVEDQKRMEELSKKLDSLTEAMKQLSREAAVRSEQNPLYDAEQPFLDMLEELADSLQKQADLAEQAADALERLRKNPDDRQAQKDLDEALDQLNKQREKDEESEKDREQLHQEMNRLRQVDELVAQGERIEQIIERQRELADRMGEFRNKESLTPEEQRRADRLARDQERLKQELEKSTAEMEQTAKQCQGECPRTAGDARKLAQQIREMKIGEDQGEAAGAARKGNGRESHEAAEAAAEKLESLAGKAPSADGAGQEMEGSADPGLKLGQSGSRQTMKQLAQGRQMPGLRGMPGRNPGQPPGQNPGNKPGQQGDSVRGSLARQTVLGPHEPMGDRAKPQRGQRGKDGPGDFRVDQFASDNPQAEMLSPENRASQRSGVGSLRSVPPAFRDQAERYFRRLAEDK